MKALQITEPGEASLVEIPEPEPQPGEVLLRVRMVGMCGSDLNTFRGKNPLVSYPRILGHEIAATIEAADSSSGLTIGSSVTVSPYTSCGLCSSCLEGRPNACQNNQTFGVQRDGAMAEFIVVPREKVFCAPGLTLPELALVEPLTIGFHAVSRGRVRNNDFVAVFGCGGVGLGAISGAARRGATVIAIDVDDTKLALALAAGAKFTLNSSREGLHERLQDLTKGRGPNVSIEAIGLPSTFRSAVEETSFCGRVVYIGYAKDPVCYETRFFVQKELDILGSRNAVPDDFKAVIAMLSAHEFPVERTITNIVPLTEAGQALRDWSSEPSRFSKILVNVGDP
jgi:threonine dehydrogenase-like Zn-dependent dehydrogenase